MLFNPGVTHRHVLFSLLFTGEEPAMSKTVPALNAKQRKELVAAGFIKLEKRGRSRHILLTGKAWAWAFDAFDEEISARLKLNPRALQGLLSKLKTYMVKNRVGLSDLLGTDLCEPDLHNSESSQQDVILVSGKARGESHGVESGGLNPGQGKSLEDQVCAAYYRLAGNGWNTRVPIAALRVCLLHIKKEVLDHILRRMQLSDDYSLVLYPYDDPREIKPVDVEAAVTIAGEQNHIVYMGER